MTTRVIVVEYNDSLRTYLHVLLTEAGYAVTALPTFENALEYLRMCPDPAVVVVGNATSTHQLTTRFFGTVEAEPLLWSRRRYVLLTTMPEQLPAVLRIYLANLAVPTLKKPFNPDDVVHAVADAAACCEVTDQPAWYATPMGGQSSATLTPL